LDDDGTADCERGTGEDRVAGAILRARREPVNQEPRGETHRRPRQRKGDGAPKARCGMRICEALAGDSEEQSERGNRRQNVAGQFGLRETEKEYGEACPASDEEGEGIAP